MAVTDIYQRIPCEAIVVKREERQRTTVDCKEIIDSIASLGVLNPILVTKDMVLIAGERRLQASINLKIPTIPVRFIRDGLSDEQIQLIELEENVKRSHLDWRDMVAAVAKVHAILESQNEIWTDEQTATFLNTPYMTIRRALGVFPHLSHPNVQEQKSLFSAGLVAERISNRITQAALNTIADTVKQSIASKAPPQMANTAVPEGVSAIVYNTNPISPIPAREPPFLHGDFLEWVRNYEGPRFNFIHCDFPYGVGLFSGGRFTSANSYSDTQDVYMTLIEALCANLDRIMTPNGHLMFWFSMEYYVKTLQAFRKHAEDLIFWRRPLVWMKTDNAGLLPDGNRQPRQIYETALVAVRGERFVVKAVSDAYASPTDRALHPSAKPEPMLKHFFRLFVDKTTTMLDPTCGAGSSIRAAEALGAERAFGIERDEESYNNAVGAYRKHQNIQTLLQKEIENDQTQNSPTKPSQD